MDLLYLSHCVPYPPDKGERIRAYHELRLLAERCRVHVVCAARDSQEREAAAALRQWCASVTAVPAPPRWSLFRALARFAAGGCLNTAYYSTAAFRRAVQDTVAKAPPSVCVVYTAAVFPCAPGGVPRLLDMVDADSEKWFHYARRRWPSTFFALEARRRGRHEIAQSRQAEPVWLTTENEARRYASFAPGARGGAMENGVDGERFDPVAAPDMPSLRGRRYVVFVGYLDYYPNRDGVIWFAREVLPVMRRAVPDLEFVVVGRNAPPTVLALQREPGVEIAGAVPDIRPYLKHAAAMTAPLRIARGIQNKVLEALAMGCPVLASDAVAATFGERIPPGLIACRTADDFRNAWDDLARLDRTEIRRAALGRFDWRRNLEPLLLAVKEAANR